MILLNDEYELRKKINQKLFDIFKSDVFFWSNQSYTIIAKSLFNQTCGFLPESSYNEKTIRMLDHYYPRALQWCTTEKIPHEEVNSIDIC